MKSIYKSHLHQLQQAGITQLDSMPIYVLGNTRAHPGKAASFPPGDLRLKNKVQQSKDLLKNRRLAKQGRAAHTHLYQLQQVAQQLLVIRLLQHLHGMATHLFVHKIW